MAHRSVTATRLIPAPAAAIFDILADPSKHSLIDGSGNVSGAKSNPARLSLGATFSMDMRMGVPYVTKNTVSEFEENRLIAWHHFAQFIWRYELEEVEGGTQVTESFDYSKPWGILLVPTGTPKKNQAGMVKTLERLEKLLTTGSAD
jgi:uncharacterized protein YndB with AHSA1/START domain